MRQRTYCDFRLGIVGLVLLLGSGVLLASPQQTGVDLKGSPLFTTPPAQWLLEDTASGHLAARVDGRWGFAAVPAGRYRLWLRPRGGHALRVQWTELTLDEGEVERLTIDSGVALRAGTFDGAPPELWWVDDSHGKRAAQITERWDATPLPPGRYKLHLVIQPVEREADVQVQAGQLSELTVEDLGLGSLLIELPATHGVHLAGAADGFQLLHERDGQLWIIPLPQGERTERVERGFRAGPVRLVYSNGPLQIRREVSAVVGRRTLVPFDPPELAKEHGFALLRLDDDGANRGIGQLLVAWSADNEPVMLRDALPGSSWLVPEDTYARWRYGSSQSTVSDLRAGETVVMPMPAVSPDGEDAAGWVDLVIQSPADGAIVETDEVELLGRAAIGSDAGTTQIVLLIDTSGSTADPCGLDLDGDGKQESVLTAEVTAARSMLQGLQKIEAESPGDALAVGLVRFSDNAQRLASIAPLDDPDAVDRLSAGLDRLESRMADGNTHYARGLETALDMIERSGLKGPRVILLMSDGKPSDPKLALAGAVRAGRTRTMIHAIGLGKEFSGGLPDSFRFPPPPQRGVDVLGLIAALAHSGGEVFALPRPGDVVAVVQRLPLLEQQQIELKRIVVENETTGAKSQHLDIRPDGAFVATVPVSLLPAGEHAENLLHATATALDGSSAQDRVRVRAPSGAMEIKRMTSALEDCSKVRETLEADRAKAEAQLDRCRRAAEAESEESRQAIAAAREATAACADEGRRLATAISDCAGQREAMAEEKRQLAAELDTCRADCRTQKAACEHALDEAHDRTVASASERQRLAASLEETRRLLDACKQDIDQGTASSAVLHERASRCERSEAECRSALEQERRRGRDAQAERDHLAKQLEAQRAALDRSDQEHQRLVERAVRAEREAADLSPCPAEHAHCRERLTQLQDRLQAALAQGRSCTDTLAATRQALDEAQARIAVLEQENAALAEHQALTPRPPGRLRITAVTPDGRTPERLLPRVELILDVSNSMWGRIDGEPKITLARRVIRSVAERLPAGIPVALRVYGHRRDYRNAGACTDTELLIPFTPLDREALVAQVDGLRPRGKTPIAYSLRQVPGDFAGVSGRRVVVLVTDGEEECGGDYLRETAALGEQGHGLILHIVGLSLIDDAVKQTMQQAAEQTGGRFVDAQSASELEAALEASFRIPFEVLDAAGQVQARGLVDLEPVQVSSGVYKVRVDAPGGAILLESVTVRPREQTELTLDHPTR